MEDTSITIEAGAASKFFFKDLWRYRELFYFLSWRDVIVQYKQTTIGVLWSILRPFLTMVVFSIIFGRLAKLPSEGSPYPAFVFSAMLPWQLFAGAFSESSNSLVNSANLVSKIYFPRVIIPASTILVALFDFIISFCLLAMMLAFYGIWPNWRWIFILPFVFVVVLIALGCGLWFSTLNVKYRDFRYIIPFIVQFGLFISPVGYSSGIISLDYRFLYSLNPLVGVINGFRWVLLGGQSNFHWAEFGLSLLIALVIFIFGFLYFSHMEKTFADNI